MITVNKMSKTIIVPIFLMSGNSHKCHEIIEFIRIKRVGISCQAIYNYTRHEQKLRLNIISF